MDQKYLPIADLIYNFVQIFTFQYIISQFYGQFSHKNVKFGYQYTFCNIADSRYQYF